MVGSRTSPIFNALRVELNAREAELVEIPLIQPADPFLDMAGEDLRRRIFLTENENGDSLCLRPEFTIPVCRNHIALNAATPKRYAYLGEVFRQRRDGAAEFLQAGIEDLGAADEAASDTRSLADALSCVKAIAPDAPLEIVLGDQSSFRRHVEGARLAARLAEEIAALLRGCALHGSGACRTDGHAAARSAA
ncbi:ATP phosphoribosyltransferase regulatory subunit [Brucella suis]|uniref:ATP phosphoribosyltransferase regulatory subunit n=1 Tax=Brucella suis TaxID=29461 RepID=UPI001FFEF447|nr:ATP phosphoribosyltransferase regulatory subunit [Brucella suis]